LQGAFGAMGALALLGGLFAVMHSRFDGELAALVGVEPSFLPWPFVIGMIALGAVLGGIAASLGLRRLVQV